MQIFKFRPVFFFSFAEMNLAENHMYTQTFHSAHERFVSTARLYKCRQFCETNSQKLIFAENVSELKAQMQTVSFDERY